MLAAALHGVRDMRVEERLRPRPGPAELLLRMEAVSVCGSDLHYYLEGGIGSDQIDRPHVLGHEYAATVVDERAAEFGLEPGALVAVDPARSCGRCEMCRRGHHNLCPDVHFTGTPPHDGALMEYLVAPPSALFPVPEGFDPVSTALLEPLGVAVHALDLARLRPMETVAVLGAGPIGLLLAQVARLSGAGEVHVVDPLRYRREAALSLGADAVHELPASVIEATGGRGVDHVLEATNSPLGPQYAVDSARIGGKLVLVGIPDGDEIALRASSARRKGLTVRFSRRMGDVYPRAIEMVRQGRVELDKLVTHRFPLSRAEEAFRLQASYSDGVIKSVVLSEDPVQG